MYGKRNDPDIWDQTQEFNNNAVVSPAKGFAWDNTNVQNEVTACANVTAKYGPALQCGSLDPETTIPKFLDELKAAGADTIIAEKQRQLDDLAGSQQITGGWEDEKKLG